MAHNKLADIAEQIRIDGALKTEMKAATGGTDDISADDFLRIANNHGYSITRDDLAVFLATPAGETGELNDEQLEYLSGGPNRRAHDHLSSPTSSLLKPNTELKLKL